MSDHGVTFGAHTVSHPLLPTLAVQEVKEEIAESKKAIEERTGRAASSFAYPYGGKNSTNSALLEIVKKIGFESAFVLYRNSLTRSNIHRLGRVMVSNAMTSSPFNGFSRAMFACEVSGLFDLLFGRT
jgi:peptidoglycan/xylan/chitin deacetylase (PgdA/CDA1 family)